jgi:hypothetical protein
MSLIAKMDSSPLISVNRRERADWLRGRIIELEAEAAKHVAELKALLLSHEEPKDV